MFFGIIRASAGLHDHPEPLHFEYRLRKYLLSRLDNVDLVGSNVEVDQNDPVLISGEMSSIASEIEESVDEPGESDTGKEAKHIRGFYLLYQYFRK